MFAKFNAFCVVIFFCRISHSIIQQNVLVLPTMVLSVWDPVENMFMEFTFYKIRSVTLFNFYKHLCFLVL